MISFKERESLEHNFKYHSPTDETIELHRKTREALLEIAIQIGNNIPDCRERSLALTKLEEAMFWANAAIARHISKFNPTPKPEKPPTSPKYSNIIEKHKDNFFKYGLGLSFEDLHQKRKQSSITVNLNQLEDAVMALIVNVADQFDTLPLENIFDSSR